jgi:thiol-disulfide isomerase/thioredoxin
MTARYVAKSTIVSLALVGVGFWAASPTLAQTEEKPAPTLKVGDKAPPLAVEKWLKGGPIAQFEPGKVYALEFWATWCGPCIASMPDLTELQKTYKEKGLTIVGVNVRETKEYSDETLTKVEAFVKEQGERMDYVVAYDGKSAAMWNAYMKAAGRGGIPTTFLIDGTGAIAWIGHPMWLDMPLEASLGGKWDPVSGPQQLAKAEERLGEIQDKLGSAPKEALAAWEAFAGEYPIVARKLAGMGFQVLLAAQEYSRAYKLAAELVEKAIATKDANALNALAWTIVDPEGKVENKDLELALNAATKADEFSKHENPSIMDTLARVYFVKGEVDRAIEFQTKAVALAKEQMKPDLQKTLEVYQAAKK